MKLRRMGDTWVVLVERGEDVVASLQKAAAEARVTAAQVSAIGALEWVELGLYYLESRTYQRRRMEGPLEIASLQGSVSLIAGKPVLHAHTVLSDAKMQAFGGHLFAGEVGPSCEAFLRVLPGTLEKVDDPPTGLKLWRF